MKKCYSCGTENREDTLFCEWCGKRLTAEMEERMANPAAVNADNTKESFSGVGHISHKEEANMSKTGDFVLQVGRLYDGKVTRILPIGAFVELAPGCEGMVHISKLADYRVERVEDVVKLGDMIWVKTLEIDGRGRINLSHKDALREIEINRRNGIVVPSTYRSVEKQADPNEFVPQVGGLYDGKVTRIIPIGAFVELAPGCEGLLHISKLANHLVEKVEDVVNLGDMVWVKVTEIDGRGRINLSRKDALREIEINAQHGIAIPSTYRCGKKQVAPGTFEPQVGGLYNGKVVRILPIGAFVELAPGCEGMLHISKLADYRVEKVEDVVNLGDMVWVKVTEIDGRGRINLSRKDAVREIEIKRQNGDPIT